MNNNNYMNNDNNNNNNNINRNNNSHNNNHKATFLSCDSVEFNLVYPFSLLLRFLEELMLLKRMTDDPSPPGYFWHFPKLEQDLSQKS